MAGEVLFFSTQDTNITTEWVRVNFPKMSFFVDGVFDGAKVTLQVSPNEGANVFDHPDGVADDAKLWAIAELGEVWVRAKLENADTNTELFAMLTPHPDKSA